MSTKDSKTESDVIRVSMADMADEYPSNEKEKEKEKENESESESEEESSSYDSEGDDALDEQLSGGDPHKFRMYRNSYPAKGDIVVVEVKKIQGIVAATCNMLEYNNLEAMLLLSELQRRRIRSVKKVIKEGRQEIVKVIKVNKDKQFVDLSKKRVDPEDIPPCEEKWNKSKASHSIMRQVAVLSKSCAQPYSMKDLYKLFGWAVAKDYGHLYDGFKSAWNDWEAFLEKYPAIPEDVRSFLKKNIDKRLKPLMVTVRAKVELTCFTVEGVEAIRRSLRAGLALAEEKEKLEFDDKDTELKIRLVAPPLFTVSVSTYEPAKGKKLVTKAVEAMKKSILESKGTINIKQSATVIQMDM